MNFKAWSKPDGSAAEANVELLVCMYEDIEELNCSMWPCF